MGNSKSNVVASANLSDFDNQDLYIPNKAKEVSDVFNYEVLLYKDLKRGPGAFMCCIEKYTEPDHFSDLQVQEFNKRIESEHTTLVKLLGFCSYSNSDSMCGNTFSQCYFLEYPIATLTDEIDLRFMYKKDFTELELWGFLRSIISGLLAIQQAGQTCRNISASTIYINYNGIYQISQLGFVKDSSLFDEIVLKIFSNDMYLSPRQIEILRDGATLQDSSDPFSSDIFSLGVLLIEMIYLNDQSLVYSYTGDDMGVDIGGLQEMLSSKEKTHSKVLLKLIGQMIQKEEESRIQLSQLYDEVNRNYHRVLLNDSSVDLDVKHNQEQHRPSEMLELLRDRKSFDAQNHKRRSSSGAQMEDIIRRRRGEVGKNKKYTIKPIYIMEDETKDFILEEKHHKSVQAPSPVVVLGSSATGAEVAVEEILNNSQSSSMHQDTSSQNSHKLRHILKREFEKLHGHEIDVEAIEQLLQSKKFKNKGYKHSIAEIMRLKMEAEELEKQQKELLDVEVKNDDLQDEIDVLARKILENMKSQKQIEQELEEEKSDPEQDDDDDDEQAKEQEYTDEVVFQQNQQPKNIIVNSRQIDLSNNYNPYDDEANDIYSPYYNQTPQHNSPYIMFGNVIGSRQNGGNGTPSSTRHKRQSDVTPQYNKKSQFIDISKSRQDPATLQSSRQFNIRYDQRVNKKNLTTSRYSAINSIFENSSSKQSNVAFEQPTKVQQSYAMQRNSVPASYNQQQQQKQQQEQTLAKSFASTNALKNVNARQQSIQEILNTPKTSKSTYSNTQPQWQQFQLQNSTSNQTLPTPLNLGISPRTNLVASINVNQNNFNRPSSVKNQQNTSNSQFFNISNGFPSPQQQPMLSNRAAFTNGNATATYEKLISY